MEASERPTSLNYAKVTAETLWSAYGQRSGFGTPEALTDLTLEAARHYPTDTQGHNFPHAADVAWHVMELADAYEEHTGNSLNRKLLVTAAFWHDAGSHHDFKALGYASAEEYASALLTDAAPNHGFTAEEVENVCRLIDKTRKGRKPFSIDEKILVKADIYNVGTRDFEARTTDFINEARQRNAEEKKIFLWDIFASDNIKTLAAYLVNDLTLWDGDNNWTAQALHNFNLYVSKTADKLGLKPAKYVATLGSTAVYKVFTRGIYSEAREDAN